MQSYIKKINSRFDIDKEVLMLLLIAFAYSVVVIVKNFSIPLWYDEAWRADFISGNIFKTSYAHAPVPLGYYLLIKFIDIFSQTNFSQRLIDYIALLMLPTVVYVFSRVYFDKTFAKIMIPMSLISGYIIENSSVAKPYILDVICTLILIISFHYFLSGKLKSSLFIGVSCIVSLLSFSSLFTLPSLAIIIAYKRKKTKRPKPKIIFIWLISWVSIFLLQLKFIKPQIKPLLHQHWSGLFLTGPTLTITKELASNFLSIFGVPFGRVISNSNLEISNIFFTYPQIKIESHFLLNANYFFGPLFLLTFIIGLIQVFKLSRELFSIIILIFVVELLTALAQQWPFGNARSNIFSLFLLYIIFVYGLYLLIVKGISLKKPIRLLTISLMLVLLIILFPYMSLANLMTGKLSQSQAAIGVQSNALFVAAHSRPLDYVFVSNYIGPLGFQYYYEYSSYSIRYRNTDSRNVFYEDTIDQPLITNNILNKKPQDIWIITQNTYPGYAITRDLNLLEKDGYTFSDQYNNGRVLSRQYSYVQ